MKLSAIIFGVLVALPQPAICNDAVTLTLSFGKAGKDAGIYVAKEKGYFASAGIDVSIIAGRGAGVSVSNVDAGNAQFGVSDFTSLIAARAGGSTARSVMLIYDLSPLAVASLKSTVDLVSPKSLEGHSVSAPQGSAIRSQLPILFKLNGVDAKRVRLVNVTGSAFVQTLLQGEVDVSSAFINESGVPMAIEAKKAGKELTWLRFRDFGLDIYATTLVTSERLIKDNPDLIRRMVGALVKGYSDMVADPTEAAGIMLKQEPTLPADVIKAQVEETVALCRTSRFQDHGFGWADATKLAYTIGVTTEALDIKAPSSPETIHTNAFLPGR